VSGHETAPIPQLRTLAPHGSPRAAFQARLSLPTGQWRCRICSFNRWHIVTVKRKNGSLYTTCFYACSGCSVMFLNPEQFSAFSDAAPNIELPTVISLPVRRK